ncbi:MAG: TetR/AcrR family transcriptional regulator [Candidatus Cloacimonetes bacterium]|nr:TetR/AcrR family transcriptional regulator [Candidatus Cloacimonadota bacterium]
MNKRTEQKQNTRQLILRTAKACFIDKGFLETTTAEIASRAEIAHGTLFLHFKTKEILIVEILDNELEQVNDKIQTLIARTADISSALKVYLDFLEREEDLFSVLARELPFYPDALRGKILFREAIIRNHFQQIIKEGINRDELRDIDPIQAITFLFSTLNYYLSMRKIFREEQESVIGKFRDKVIKTFLQLIEKG